MTLNQIHFRAWSFAVLFWIFSVGNVAVVWATEDALIGGLEQKADADGGETLATLLAGSAAEDAGNGDIAVAKEQRVNSWLDIRPRSIESVESVLIERDKLPQDTSGLPPLDDAFWVIQIRATDLKYADVAFASSHRYRPLYFEDRLLERYGSITGVLKHCPPIHAAAQFAISSAALPLSALTYPPCREVSTGHPSRCEPSTQLDMLLEHAKARSAAARKTNHRR